MIYKIEFDPRVGSWMVKLQRFYLFWVPVCEDKESLKFSNYDKASEWVKSVGLDNVYRNWADRPPVGYSAVPCVPYVSYPQPYPATWSMTPAGRP